MRATSSKRFDFIHRQRPRPHQAHFPAQHIEGSWETLSKLNLRSHLPIHVTRGSLVILNTGPDISFIAASSVLAPARHRSDHRAEFLKDGERLAVQPAALLPETESAPENSI